MNYSSKIIRLMDVANIFTGYNYRRNDISIGSEGIDFIQSKDICENLTDYNSVFKINKNLIKNKFILENNDILFSAKGKRNFAFLYKKESKQAAASSTFFILKIKTSDIIPEYLAWYLNQKPAQDYIKSQSTGTFIPSINKMKLSRLIIPLPPIQIQEKIVKIDLLRKKEKEILNSISSKKDLLIENILYKKIKTL